MDSFNYVSAINVNNERVALYMNRFDDSVRVQEAKLVASSDKRPRFFDISAGDYPDPFLVLTKEQFKALHAAVTSLDIFEENSQ